MCYNDIVNANAQCLTLTPNAMPSYIFVINSGSSSLKFKLFEAKTLKEAAGGIMERIGLKDSFLKIKVCEEEKRNDFPDGISGHEQALKIVFKKLCALRFTLCDITAIGHRVVHGGEEFTEPTVVTSPILQKLGKYSALAPLHNPANLAGIRACRKLLPGIPNVAVFDTAFYRSVPDYAYLYAIPYRLYEKYRIRRYGFHGISHRYVAGEAAKALKKPLGKLKIISCHLGSGASITAVKYGQAVETSMGFTPLEGLTMGTRCGDVDPSLTLYLIRNLKMTPGEVDDLLNKKSGLLGISGISNDMREILAAAGCKVEGFKPPRKYSRQEKCRSDLALKMFIYDIQRYIGQYALIMGGVDAIVFTAGIGERNATVRKMVADGLGFLGKVKILAIPTDEELMIARETAKIIKSKKSLKH